MEPEFDVAGEAAWWGAGSGDGAPGEGWGDTANFGEKCICPPFAPAVSQESKRGRQTGMKSPGICRWRLFSFHFIHFTFYVAVKMGHRISCLLDKHHP